MSELIGENTTQDEDDEITEMIILSGLNCQRVDLGSYDRPLTSEQL